MGRKLDKDFVKRLKLFFKQNDTQYIVLNIDPLLAVIDQMQYLELQNLIDNYDDHIENVLHKEVDEYFVIPRNKLPQCKSQKEFEDLVFKNNK